MKFTALVLIVCLGVLSYPIFTNSAGNLAEQNIFVFKLDGTKHCESNSEVELDSMELELTSIGITVISKRKGYDGREGIAICGSPTGQINIYEIISRNLPNAVKLGFEKLPINHAQKN